MAEFASLNNAVRGRKVKPNNTGDLKSFWTKFEESANNLSKLVYKISELTKNGATHNNYELYQNLELLQQQIDNFIMKVEPSTSRTCNLTDDAREPFVSIFTVPTEIVRLFEFYAYRKNWTLTFITPSETFYIKTLADLEKSGAEIDRCNALLKQIDVCVTLITDYLNTGGKILEEE